MKNTLVKIAKICAVVFFFLLGVASLFGIVFFINNLAEYNVVCVTIACIVVISLGIAFIAYYHEREDDKIEE